MSSAKKALGKGLAALMGDSYSEFTTPASSEGGEIIHLLSLETLEPNIEQPRRHFDDDALAELKESILQHGIIQPILVRVIPDVGGDERYQIIAGERRWRAAKLAGLEKVPCIIRDLDRSKTLEIALLENIQRENLNPIEEAAAYFKLMEEFKYTQEALAASVGKSRSHIANLLRLLTLPDSIKRLVESNEITMGHARAVLNHPHADAIIDQVVKNKLSVRETEALAKASPNAKANATVAPIKGAAQPKTGKRPMVSGLSGQKDDPDLTALEEAISESLGLKVSITYLGDGGVVSIDYHSLSDLDRILRRLGGNPI